MIYTVMNELNNHFVRIPDSGPFEIVADGITGNFTETFLAGMYVVIHNSYLNDGVYKITSVESNKITVDTTLNPENKEDFIILWPSTPPTDFINLVTEIENYNEKIGVSSYSIDDYSETFEGNGTWQSAFKSKLNAYRRVYNDIRIDKKYRWQDRW